MRLAFLGTGAAFSLERHNGAVVVERRLLLDAGAPLLRHLDALGLDPARLEAVFLSHFHGDHVAGLPQLVQYRAARAPGRPLTVIAPASALDRLEQLLELSLGEAWPRARTVIPLSCRVADAAGEVAGVGYRAISLEHGGADCRGYRLLLDGRILAYAGDTTVTPALDELVSGADVAITEATSAEASIVHTSWTEARSLAARHPQTRFFFNHLFSGSIPGSVGDLQVVDA